MAFAGKLVTMLRLLAFMVLVYLLLAWMVERNSRNPKSKVRAFFRTLCSPATGLAARFLPGADQDRLLKVSAGVVAAVWVVLIALDEVLLRAQ
jgi:uncharacterized protein YggT (Ycf19 family)